MKFVSSHFKNEKIFHINDVTQINNNDVFHRFDMYFMEEIDEIFKTKGTPGLFLSDIIHYENFDPNVQFLGLPVWLERERKGWFLEEFNNKIPNTTYCFNFMVNKKQINRYLCIKLVEVFNLQNFVYTWSGVDNYFDCGAIIQENNQLDTHSPLSQTQFNKILSPIEIEPVFYIDRIVEKNSNIGAITEYGSNRKAWDWGLNQMFVNSAVSLITESIAYQKASTFSEKTLFSLLGLNFPIWIGGYKQAEMWQRLGFDTFNDVINHDYQYYDTLLERCCYAFILNKKILTDLEYAKVLREKHIDRLLHNRYLILSDQLANFVKEKLKYHSFYTSELKDSFDEYLRFFGIDKPILSPTVG